MLKSEEVYVPAVGFYRVTDTDTGKTYNVSADDYPEDPRDWFDDEEVYVFTGSLVESPLGFVQEVFNRLVCEQDEEDKALEILVRWRRVFHNDERYFDIRTVNGYVQSAWCRVLVIANDEHNADVIVQMFGQYFRRDIFMVTDEEENETVGGIYADNPEDAVKQYLETYV